MSEIVLTGLDGKNPIAFMAGLGVLEALSDRAREGQSPPKLSFRKTGTLSPVIETDLDRAGLLDVLWQDLRSFAEEPAIEGLRYKKEDGKAAHDLKPRPERFAEYLRGLVTAALANPEEGRRGLAFAAAFATDVAVDNNGNTKPTALHFTAGQQEFLAMVAELIHGARAEDLEEALFGPWLYDRPLPVLQWDNGAARDYALRASDPSKEKKLGVPGADWLAFRGLPFLRVAPVGDAIVTTGCRGRWKTGSFRWPLWEVPLSRAVVRSMLLSEELREVDPQVLEARGISVVFEAAIRRSDQGGYGSFSPAKVAERVSSD